MSFPPQFYFATNAEFLELIWSIYPLLVFSKATENSENRLPLPTTFFHRSEHKASLNASKRAKHHHCAPKIWMNNPRKSKVVFAYIFEILLEIDNQVEQVILLNCFAILFQSYTTIRTSKQLDYAG